MFRQHLAKDKAAQPLRVFVGFNEVDREHKARFLKHLAVAERIGALDVWSQDHIVAGREWHVEICQAIDAAHVAVLLLSPDFLASRVSYEVMLPRLLARRQQDGMQVFLVIMRSCTWELEPGLGQLPFWPHEISAIGGLQASQQDEVFSQIAREIAKIAEQQYLVHSLDGPHVSNMYVHRPQEEKYALNRLRSHGLPVVLQGPQYYGKGSLLSYLLCQIKSRAANKNLEEMQIVRIRLSSIDSANFKTLDALLRQIARQFIRQTRPEEAEEYVRTAWRRGGSETHKLTSLLRSLLNQLSQLFIAIEDADCVWGLPFQDAFFACLRSWVERQEEPWTKLRLLVTVSMEPVVLENADHSSFFASASPIRLSDFNRAQIGQLAIYYKMPPESRGLDELIKLVGGHPYLSRLALAESSLREIELESLLVDHDSVNGIFTPHLLRHRYWLERHGLLGVISRILSNTFFRPALTDYCQLYSQGLLVEHGHVGTYRLRCKLYEDYFRALCRL